MRAAALVNKGSEPTCGDAAGFTDSPLSECPVSQDRLDHAANAENDRFPPIFPKTLDFSPPWSGSVGTFQVARIAGLHSVQGEGMARARGAERNMPTETSTKPKTEAAKVARTKPTRREQLTKLLNRKSGASITQIQKAFGWQPHTARAAISTLRKRGTLIERTDTDKGAVYRAVTEG